MNRIIKTTTLILLCSLSSCISRMSIRVDSFDMLAFYQSEEYKFFNKNYKNDGLAYKASSNYTVEIFGLIINPLKDSLNSFSKSKDDQLLKVDKETIPKMISEAEKFTTTLLVNASYKYRLAFALSFSENKKLSEVNYLVYQGDSIIEYLFDELNKVIGVTINDKIISDKTFNQIKINYNNQINSKTSLGESIVYDVFQSLVTKAPNKYWTKYKCDVDIKDTGINDVKKKRTWAKAKMNKTTSTTFFGNSDIAIKMDAPGNFVVKGVRLDANEAFKASFKVLNMGIKYLAYSQGIAIPDNANNSSSNSLSKIPELEKLDSNKNELQKLKQNDEIQTFVNDLLSQYDYLRTINPKTDTSIAKSVIRQINGSFEVYKKQLNK